MRQPDNIHGYVLFIAQIVATENGAAESLKRFTQVLTI